MSLNRIATLKAGIKKASDLKTRKEGMLEEKKKTLKELCGTSDPEKATSMLKKLREQLAHMEKEIKDDLELFEERFSDVLE